jgi:hypothetical protein
MIGYIRTTTVIYQPVRTTTSTRTETTTPTNSTGGFQSVPRPAGGSGSTGIQGIGPRPA